MMKFRVGIYFNKQKGYMVTCAVPIKNMGAFGTFASIILDPNASRENLNKAVQQMLVLGRDTDGVEREEVSQHQSWEHFGYKSYGTFCKNFNLVMICVEGHQIQIQEWEGKRGYAPKKDVSPVQYSIADIYILNYGAIILPWLGVAAPAQEEKAAFQTLNGNMVSFHAPDEEFFDDLEDGHSDFYQVYAHSSSPTTHIAFIIDNGYEAYTMDDIQRKWESDYGLLKQFEYCEVGNQQYTHLVMAENSTYRIQSYLFPDGDMVLECLFVIAKSLSIKEQELVNQQFTKVVKSVEVVYAQ